MDGACRSFGAAVAVPTPIRAGSNNRSPTTRQAGIDRCRRLILVLPLNRAFASPPRATTSSDGSGCDRPLHQSGRPPDHPVMPLYMDRHEFELGREAAAAHLKDLEVQGRFGVRSSRTGSTTSVRRRSAPTAPDVDAVESVHRAPTGSWPTRSSKSTAERSSGSWAGSSTTRPASPSSTSPSGPSCSRTSSGPHGSPQELGDAGAMSVLRMHDEIVREAVPRNGGSEVKHTGDGIMAAFPSVTGAIEAVVHPASTRRRAIGRRRRWCCGSDWPRASRSRARPVRSGGPVGGSALRPAEPGSILVPPAVRDLRPGERLRVPETRPAAPEGLR